MPTLWHCPILCCREVSLQGRLERIHICLLLINTKESIHDLGGLISVLAVLRKFSSKLRDDHEMRLLTLKWIYSVITSDSRIRVNASSSFLFFQRHSSLGFTLFCGSYPGLLWIKVFFNYRTTRSGTIDTHATFFLKGCSERAKLVICDSVEWKEIFCFCKCANCSLKTFLSCFLMEGSKLK